MGDAIDSAARSATSDMTSVPRIAADFARRLLRPDVLDEVLRSGLFLVRSPDYDYWDALAPALVAELRRLGALVICVDLVDCSNTPLETLRHTLHAELLALDAKASWPEHLGRGTSANGTLAVLIEQVVELSGRDLVLMLDHVGMLGGRTECDALRALKAARDAVNLRANAVKRFFLVATDAEPSAVRRLAMDPNHAFFGAPIEVLPRI